MLHKSNVYGTKLLSTQLKYERIHVGVIDVEMLRLFLIINYYFIIFYFP